MKKRLISLLLGFIIASTLGTREALAARTSQPQQGSFALKLGVLFPNSSDARDFGGQTQLALGLDYTFAATHGASPNAASVYFDYLGGSNNAGYIHSGGLGLEFRTLGSGYIGAGLGVYNTAERTPGGKVSGNSTGGGGKIFVGVGLGGAASLELDYHLMPSALGVNPSGLGLELNYQL